MIPDTNLPPEYTAWGNSVYVLAIKNLTYLTPRRKVKLCHEDPQRLPVAVEVTVARDDISAALRECELRAKIVGTEQKRIEVSSTLSRAERRAKQLAAEVVAPIPDASAWEALWRRAAVVVEEFYRGSIANELEDASLLFKQRAEHQQETSHTLPSHRPQYVTLLQAASLAQVSKRSLERWVKRRILPPPDVRGNSGKAHKWKWENLRPALASESGHALPEQFPSLTEKK
jgi:hypothetical protein